VAGDANDDGIANGKGIALVASNWLHTDAGEGGSIASLPEPSTWALLATGVGALLVVSRRKSQAAQQKRIATGAF
jgi:hypothetical protein